MDVELIVHPPQGEPTRRSMRAGDRWVIGRAADAQLLLPSSDVSRRHALLAVELDGPAITDLGSQNGTLLSGEAIPPHVAVPVEDGDMLQIGPFIVQVDLHLGKSTRTLTRAWRREDAVGCPPGYRLTRLLGEGSYGRVWEARREADGQAFAIKVLRERADLEMRRRFNREGELLVGLVSPCVVQVHACQIVQDRPCIVMELVQGVSADRLLQDGPLPLPLALQVGVDLATALCAAHAYGVIHRDVKPANVLLTPHGRAKLADFGIALFPTLSRLTETGIGLGSLPYVAPEQATEAKRATQSSDLYGLGATLFHLVTGRTPLGGGGGAAPAESPARLRDLLRRIAEEPPPPVNALVPDCPAPLAELIAELLRKAPRDRPPSARAVQRALALIQAEHTPGAGRESSTERHLPTVRRPRPGP